MKKILTLSLILLPLVVWAQKPAGDPKGGISPEMLEKMRDEFESITK